MYVGDETFKFKDKNITVDIFPQPLLILIYHQYPEYY